MAKRKREMADQAAAAVPAAKSWNQDGADAPRKPEAPALKSKETAAKKLASKVNGQGAVQDAPAQTATSGIPETTTVQIITGSYERVLHGFTATVAQSLITGPDTTPKEDERAIDFSDTFLFNAHTSAIRCLALSPPPENPNGKVFLATGATDERINLFSISLCPPAPSKSTPKLPNLNGSSITENSKNKELGTLLHHSSSITALHFPTRAKLLSSAEDSTIAITRTRDWQPLSTIKAPIPKPQGRPSGDTAGPGEVPSGVNDFAIHPSMKLMLSVGKGEKCMRLWNLVTGKKAGVLSFSKDILSVVGESRFGTGEGRRVVWDAEGEEFALAFERGVVVFGIDCQPKASIVPSPRTKIHQMHYLPEAGGANILAISTEDGRIMFYDTASTAPAPSETETSKPASPVRPCALLAQLGGPAAGISGRVKDFEIIPLHAGAYLTITASSDGSVRLWTLTSADLAPSKQDSEKPQTGFVAKQVGRLLGTYSTGTRITCLKAFIMTGEPDKAVDDEEDQELEKSAASSSDEEESE
jgi:protein MAK11